MVTWFSVGRTHGTVVKSVQSSMLALTQVLSDPAAISVSHTRTLQRGRGLQNMSHQQALWLNSQQFLSSAADRFVFIVQ